MIRLTRTRTAEGLHPSFTGAKLAKKLIALSEARLAHSDKIAFKGALGDWSKTKKHLQQESRNKCAYCEADTATVAHGDVEHFRPKSVYWWLALCVDNYVYACQICNQSYKSDGFPLHGNALEGPELRERIPLDPQERLALAASICPDPIAVDEVRLQRIWATEKPGLPHPYLEDPETLFAWKVVETNAEIHLVPRTQRSVRARRAVEAVEANLGLNRELLLRQRYLVYEMLVLLLDIWKNDGPARRAQASEKLRAMCDGSRPFTGMCRYFCRQAGFSPLTG